MSVAAPVFLGRVLAVVGDRRGHPILLIAVARAMFPISLVSIVMWPLLVPAALLFRNGLRRLDRPTRPRGRHRMAAPGPATPDPSASGRSPAQVTPSANYADIGRRERCVLTLLFSSATAGLDSRERPVGRMDLDEVVAGVVEQGRELWPGALASAGHSQHDHVKDFGRVGI